METPSAKFVSPLSTPSLWQQRSQPGSPQSEKASKNQSKNRRSICLDYLKGKCNAKRSQCRFRHPDLTSLQKRFEEKAAPEAEVCELYALTGHCKFGPSCMKLHLVCPWHRPRGDNNAAIKTKKVQIAKRQPFSESDVPEPLDFEGMVASILEPLDGTDEETSPLPSPCSSDYSNPSPRFAWPTSIWQKNQSTPFLEVPYQGTGQLSFDVFNNMHSRTL